MPGRPPTSLGSPQGGIDYSQSLPNIMREYQGPAPQPPLNVPGDDFFRQQGQAPGTLPVPNLRALMQQLMQGNRPPLQPPQAPGEIDLPTGGPPDLSLPPNPPIPPASPPGPPQMPDFGQNAPPPYDPDAAAFGLPSGPAPITPPPPSRPPLTIRGPGRYQNTPTLPHLSSQAGRNIPPAHQGMQSPPTPQF